MREFKELLRRAGLRPTHAERGFHSGVLAVWNGMPVSEVVECLVRNRSNVFGTSTKQTAPRVRVGVPAPGVGIDRWPGRRPETTEGAIGWTSRNSNES